ncbi:hypothetical protein SISNIDRAFT_487316 [Sistotremastrum niveocremeum HHB9708]|uniref:DUF6535 domain-containing protein n=1 Tax=Sistotremastrum niveocremeum HHB9708 TaxID=1314777 RepID=A0A164SNF3_9AGAM|nr:hypothetical protein SISNIDRAFT_487316 [Sistotremastrum niveocremeum HHB9708]
MVGCKQGWATFALFTNTDPATSADVQYIQLEPAKPQASSDTPSLNFGAHSHRALSYAHSGALTAAAWTMIDDVDEAPSRAKPDLAEALVSRFDKLLFLIENQNDLMAKQREELAGQHQTLKKHTGMLESLEKDATKDDRAHEPRTITDEQTWGALDNESLAKIKVTVDGWRDLMQVSLVFTALFLTVVTAFISPIIQSFTSPTGNNDATIAMPSGKNPLPATSTQLIALFYYLAIITSICNSILCVLGMQWAGRLTAIPIGRTNLERTLAREKRKALADHYMLPLMGILFWTLLAAIIFFVVGFLIQMWELAFSFAERAPILVIGGALATALSVIILGIINATTCHAALQDNSPFEGPLSHAVQIPMDWARQLFSSRRSNGWKAGANQQPDLERAEMTLGREDDVLSLVDVQALTAWEDTEDKDTKALKTYARLVLNTSNTELLERCVPSFDFGNWYAAGDTIFPVFKAVHERFLATDTSFRVKETTVQQLLRFSKWHGWTRPDLFGYQAWRGDLESNRLTQWCKDQCTVLVNSGTDRAREYFPFLAFLTSLEEDNRDLRGYQLETYQASVAAVICSYQNGEVGERRDIFKIALALCKNLVVQTDSFLKDGRSDEATEILSRVSPSSVMHSIFQGSIHDLDFSWTDIGVLVTFITERNEMDIIHELAPFFSSFRKADLGDSEKYVTDYLADLSMGLPPHFVTPNGLDLSPSLAIVTKDLESPRLIFYLYYLTRGGVETLSDLHPARQYWQDCLDIYRSSIFFVGNLGITRLFERYYPRFIPLPSLSDDESDDLIFTLISLFKDDYHILTLHAFKGPFWELLDLDDDRRSRVTITILQEVPLALFIFILMRTSRWDWDRVKSLISSTVQDRELELLAGLTNLIEDHRFMHDHATCMIVLDLLAHLIPNLPSTFSAPPGFDLSELMEGLTRCRPNRKRWRVQSDTIMFYLNHGAFELLANLDYAKHFFEACIQDTRKMKYWDDDAQTSGRTRERSKFYLKTIDTKRQSTSIDIARG